MPLFMDRHDLNGVTEEDIAAAHTLDLKVQSKYGVRYLSYWFDYERQHAFCFAEAPTAKAAEDVHREAHGLIAYNIIEVDPDRVVEFLGSLPNFPPGEPTKRLHSAASFSPT